MSFEIAAGYRCCSTFRVSIDIISLSKFEAAPIVIPSDIGLDGELDLAFLLFSCLGLGVKSVSECISPDGQSQKHCHAFIVQCLETLSFLELGCSSLGLMLHIIGFLPCLTREDCSFFRQLLLVSNLTSFWETVPLLHWSRNAPRSSGVSRSLPGRSRRGLFQVVMMVAVGTEGSVGVTFSAPASAFCPSSPSRFFSLLSFMPLTERSLWPSLVAPKAKKSKIG